MIHLLTETSIYVSLPNECYCQLAGPPLIYSSFCLRGGAQSGRVKSKDQVEREMVMNKRKFNDHEGESRVSKRRRIDVAERGVLVETRKQLATSHKM